MYLRRHRRKKNGAEYESWSLVESVRTMRGPRQRIVSTLGKLPGMEREERIGWEEIARVAESWYGKTALEDLLGVSVDKINEDRLYRALDVLLIQKDALCRHLQQRYGELFGVSFNFLLYDITSTYFEGSAEKNAQAKRGYSRDHREDCVQVCIGLVVSKEGFPLGYEVFDGNRSDVTTLEEIVEVMEKKYGQAQRIWVMDRWKLSVADELERNRSPSVVETLYSTHPGRRGF